MSDCERTVRGVVCDDPGVECENRTERGVSSGDDVDVAVVATSAANDAKKGTTVTGDGVDLACGSYERDRMGII